MHSGEHNAPPSETRMGQQLKVNQAAFDIGQMAERMAEGYFMHLAAIQVAKDLAQ